MFPAALHETSEHATLRQQARRFAREHIAPFAYAWDEAEAFPRELYTQLADSGLLGLAYPEAYGGGGGDLSHALACAEELVVHGTNVGVVVGLGSHGIALPPILAFGTDEQKARFVRPVLRGDAVAALAITEPGCGSDVASITTRAERDGQHYLVTGAKTFITSGTRALTSEVLVRHLRGEATPSQAAMAKNAASDMCTFVCDSAVQLFGGYGYMRETVVERLYRDARLFPIGGGTREIMNEIISKTERYDG